MGQFGAFVDFVDFGPLRESEAGEKNGPESVKTDKFRRPCETPKSTGTRTNPRKRRSRQKKINPIRGLVFLFGGAIRANGLTVAT
jgi:hypothetical protein